MSEHFVIDTIPVEVRRNKRRRTRIGMLFDPAGYVIMDAPVDTSEAEIRSVVSEHYRWLRFRLTKVQEAPCHRPPSNIVSPRQSEATSCGRRALPVEKSARSEK